MAESSTIIEPVYGLVNLMNKMFVSLSKGDDGLFEIIQHRQSVESEYYHYNCCGEIDEGWGCAYRALQTLISCITQDKSENKDNTAIEDVIHKVKEIKLEDKAVLTKTIPSIKDIQSTLKITKPRQWIDPDYAHTYLSKYRVKGRVEQVWSDKEDELNGLPEKIMTHFEEEGTHIMIDDVIYAYTLAGCVKIIAKPDTIFKHTHYVLVLDPHTTNEMGLEDYSSILMTQCKSSYKNSGIKLEVEGLAYEGGDVFGTSGVFWLPFDVMFSRGKHKHFKIYFPYKRK
ncbi:hypothetical protein LOD99_4421 [Oopsacas minuta]|uniref:UFSP1/2/DUB catalytic domain-containing protein n=1 Tax=Oopsacas minuta TaxID=111878 RepID=A0AAV7JVF5_9METZ|nr:hypothetical protein LOD99_4421 [Oopsacas minuta]